MRALFSNLLTASVSGSIVILAVLVLRLVLRKTPKKFICILWMVAGLRLLLPVPCKAGSAYSPQPFACPSRKHCKPTLCPCGALWRFRCCVQASSPMPICAAR